MNAKRSAGLRALAAAALASFAIPALAQVPPPGAPGVAPQYNPAPAAPAAPAAASVPASQIPGAVPAAAPAAQPPVALPPIPGAQIDPEKVMSNMFGITPEQIRELRKQSAARQKAASEFPGSAPRPVTTSAVASLAPGATPPVVRLFPNFASSIVVTDATGQPWPIENFTVGDRDKFEVKRLDESGANGGSALSVVPLGYYAQSNLVLYLKGLPTPVAVTFIAGQKEVDYRVDLRVQGRGPNAQVAAAGLPASTNSQLLSLLEGVAPQDAKALRVSSNEAQAWMTRSGRMFLRTQLQIISPAWVGSVRSADGMTAYEMMPATSVLVMRDGQIRTLTVEGW